MARKSRKNVQATPAVVVGPVQYKVALYARISVENEQKREADTIGNQIALLKDFVSQHQDLVVFDLYCDDDISGVSFVRPEFARMMNDIRAGKVTCVIVKDLSRLGRNMIESGEYIEQIFPRMGVRFISVTDRFDSLRDDADISIQLKNFANEAYARDISKKIRAVKRTQQLAGKWTTGTPPYGYMLDPDDKYHLFPDPQTGPIVLAIFRMVAENHTLHFIAKTLNEQEVPSPGRYLYDIAEEIKRLLVEQYESRGNLAAGKRTADQIILLKDYDPEIIRNFVERVRVYPSGEIEIDMRTSSGFAFVTAS